MSAPEKIFATVEYIGKTDTVVCGAFGTYPMDESVEFTRTDLSQAAVAAALEAAAVIAETHQVYQAHVCAARIRALITPAQLSAANARADHARDAALVDAADIILADFYDDPDSAVDAIIALRDKPAPAVAVRAYLLRHRDTGKEEIIDAKKYNPTKLDFWVSPAAMASVEIIPLSAIAGGGDE